MQSFKGSTNFRAKQGGLLPCSEVTAFVRLVEIDQLVIRLLRPAPRRLIVLAGEDRDGRGIETLAAL